MIAYIHIKGGLGNQLFILSAAISYCIANKKTLFADFSSYQADGFGRLDEVSRIFPDLPIKAFSVPNFLVKYFRKAVRYAPDFLAVDIHCALKSQFLQERLYFGEHWQIVNALFSEKFCSSGVSFNSNNGSSARGLLVSIHTRRVNYQHLLDESYYEKAILCALDSFPEISRLRLYGDGINWLALCIEKHPILGSIAISASDENNHYVDLAEMAKSDIHISSNSSFSWWACALSSNNKRLIVAPRCTGLSLDFSCLISKLKNLVLV